MPKQIENEMKRYRIQPDRGCYDGCFPITVYWVQVYAKMPVIGYQWANVKGFDRKDKAEKLLSILENGL